MAGWIAISRDIRDHWIWSDARHAQWWLDLLLAAEWDAKVVFYGNTEIHLARGQILSSIRGLAGRWKASPQTVMNFLQVLECNEMITRDTENRITVITITNYEKYQPKVSGDERKMERPSEHHPEHIINNKINNIKINSPNTREDEEKFFEEMKSSDLFGERICMVLKCDKAMFLSLLEDFEAEIMAVEQIHKSIQDCKKHFQNWAKIAIQKKQNQNGNGTRQKPGATASDKHASRRGTEPSDFKKKDYSKGF